MIDLSSIGMNNVFVHENFATEESQDADSSDEETVGEGDGLAENDLSSAQQSNSLSLDFFALN